MLTRFCLISLHFIPHFQIRSDRFDAPNCLHDSIVYSTNTTQAENAGMKRWTLFSILVLISPNSLLQLSHRSGGPAPNTYLSSSVLSSARSSARRKQPFEIRPRQLAALFRLESSPSLPRAVPPLVTWCWALRDEGDEHDGRTGQYTGDQDHTTLLLAF